MNELQEQIFNEYLDELSRAGRTSKNVKYSLRIFFRYLNDTGINFLMVRIREAQDFQIYLTTSAADDGSVRFAKASVLNILGSSMSIFEGESTSMPIPLLSLTEYAGTAPCLGIS